MTDQRNNPSPDIANVDSSTVDVNTLHHVFKAPGVHTKHNGLLRPPMIAVYINGSDDPLYLKIDRPMTFGRDTTPQPQPTLIEFGPSSLEQGVSRQHARISWQNGFLFIEDLGSSNGTFINQVQLTPHVPKRLTSGDVVQLGQMALEIYFDTESVSETPAEVVAPQRTIEVTMPLLPASTQPAPVEYASALRLNNGLILIEDLVLNSLNQIVPNSDVTLKLKPGAESNSTLVLEIAVTDPIVQKALQNLFSDKPALEMAELKMRIIRRLG